jgi:hypothetical protein
MVGAAGVGSALLHLALAVQGCCTAILFPDNLFPSAPRELLGEPVTE